jgi:predicted phosphodiesterase
MLAILSDIHGNLEGLNSVFKDLQGFQADTIICLGDIVGYGPDPEACIDFIMEKASVTLMGNHDFALIHGPQGFNPVASQMIYSTRKRMKPALGLVAPPQVPPYWCVPLGSSPVCLIPAHSKSIRWRFIKSLPYRSERGDALFVHASPLEPISEYVFPDVFTDAWDPDRISLLMSLIKRLCFCGHTHIPCAIASDLSCVYPPDSDYHMVLDPNKKYIINTGSVGQPRDHDNRASYLLYDEIRQTITWRRIEYDITTVVKKLEEMCGKENWCAMRLLTGR